jgi:hypothetical protein
MPRCIYAAECYQGPEYEDRAVVEVDVVEDNNVFQGGLTEFYFADEVGRLRWRVAYRAARLACRGERRADLALKPDYTPACKSCNAGVRVAGAVMHALGLNRPDADQTLAAVLCHAAITALGGYRDGPPRHLGRLDFDAWIDHRSWLSEVRLKVAA